MIVRAASEQNRNVAASYYAVVSHRPSITREQCDPLGTTCTRDDGVYDCAYLESLATLPTGTTTCAPYGGDYRSVRNNYGLLIFAAIGMAVMAFSVGANDAANAWSTSVHSYAIRLRNAGIIAGIMEMLGATTLGYGVSTSLQKGITDYREPSCFACGQCDSRMTEYYVGMMSSLYGAGTFILMCSALKMPVSTTHSVVGAVIGMTVSTVGFDCLSWGWNNLSGIILSWVISPLVSGVLTVCFHYLTYYLILKAKSPRRVGLLALPALYFIVVFLIVFISLYKSPVTENVATYWSIVGGLIGGLVAAGQVLVFLLPYVRRHLPSVDAASKLNYTNLIILLLRARRDNRLFGGWGRNTEKEGTTSNDLTVSQPSPSRHSLRPADLENNTSEEDSELSDIALQSVANSNKRNHG